MNGRLNRTIEKLQDKAYRDAYVEAHVKVGIPHQIRALREQEERKWSQAELGRRSGKPANVISRLEDPESGGNTIRTCLEMASAFDVALLVKFVPYSRFLKEFEDVSPEALEVPSFSNDLGLTRTIQPGSEKYFSNVVNAIAEIKDTHGLPHVYVSRPENQIALRTPANNIFLLASDNAWANPFAYAVASPKIDQGYFVGRTEPRKQNLVVVKIPRAEEHETPIEPGWATIGRDYSEPALIAAQ